MGTFDIRLVASDLDGTLLDSQARLPPDFPEIFGRMRAHGVAFAAVSGRQIHNMRSKFPGIEDEIYFAAENGAYVTKAGEELMSLELSRGDVAELLEAARTVPNAYAVLSGKKFAYIENPDPVFLERLTSYSGYIKPVRDISEVEGDTFYKFTVCDLSNPSTNALPRFAHLRGRFQIKVSGTRWMDVTHPLADKGRALALIQRLTGATRDQTAAFGDYLNDVEMLQNARHSYAMANAHPEIKAVASRTTYSNNECGVTRALDAILPR